MNNQLNKNKIYWDFTSKLYILCIVYTVCYRAITNTLGLSNYDALSLSLCLIFLISLLSFNHMMRSRHVVLLEMIFVLLWIIWVILTTYTVHDGIASLNITKSPIFIAALCVLVFLLIYNGVGCDVSGKTFIGFSLGGVLLGLLTLISGEIFILGDTETQQLGTDLVGNPNDYGYLLVLSIISLTYTYHTVSKRYMQNIICVSVAFLSFLCILSGSRKTFLAIVLFAFLVMLFCYSKSVFKSSRRFIKLFIMIITIGCVSYWAYSNTLLGDRFQKWAETDFSGSAVDDEMRFAGRSRYYIEGVRLISENSIFGIGLNQFWRYDMWSQPSHSEYISIFCETGIPGGILYFGAYFIIIARLNRLRRVGNAVYYLRAGILLAAMLTILCLDLGRWNWDHPPTWIFLAAIGAIGFQYHDYQAERRTCFS